MALASALLLAGCAASSNPSRPESSRWQEPQSAPATEASQEVPAAAAPVEGPSAPASPPRVVIAKVGDRTVDVSRLLQDWLQTNSREVTEVLERVVTGEAVDMEAERLGIALDPQEVDQRYEEALGEMKAKVEKHVPGADLDAWIRTELMCDPLAFRENLRRDVRRSLYAERLVRGFVLTNERAEARVVVTETREEMQDVQDALAAGGSFEELARERSIDPTSKQGGRIPPILRNGTPLSRLAFITGAGAVGGPIQGADGKRWMLMRVDAILPPLEGTWEQIGPAIEASLAERPIDDPEYWQWKAEMNQRYRVDLEPFFDLVDGARP